MARMDTNPNDSIHNAIPNPALRGQAEGVARNALAVQRENDDVETLTAEATRKLLHELRVHQIELEMQNDELRVYQIELETQNDELRAAQVELEVARARYFDLYDLAPVGYCTVNEQGLILQANLTLSTLLGLARNALVKQPFRKYILGADQDVYYLCRLRLLETGKPQTCELRMVTKDGSQLWIYLTATYTRGSGGPELHIALTDITPNRILAAAVQESEVRHRALSEALQEKNVELERARRVAEKANVAKSEFLSSMSHELRTPLSAILGFAQLIEISAQPPTPAQQKSLDQITTAGWYLLDLINELLDLAKIEAGKLSLSPEPVALTTLMRECLNMMESEARQRDIVITTATNLDCSYHVHADRTRLKQALTNLLSNAIKYNTPGGSVVVDYVVKPGGRIRISVADTGGGLSTEKIAQLFQPFNRLGQEATAIKGTGIGLVVCKRLVELMGGKIGAESDATTGSVFWIELNSAQPVESKG